MSIFSRLEQKFQQYGVRGVVASTLHYMAKRIDYGLINSHSEATQANEFLAWVRFAVPGMLDQGNVDAMDYAIANIPPSKPILEIGSLLERSEILP